MARRVVINGRFVGRPLTGVERFAEEVLKNVDLMLGERHPLVDGLDLVLAVPKGAEPPAYLRNIRVERVGRLSGHAWEQIDLGLYARRDVVLGLCNFAPLVSHRSIVTVHDAHVWLIPDSFSPTFRAVYQTLLPLLLRRCSAWTTVSRYSDEALQRFKVANRPASAITGNGSQHALRWSADRSKLDAAALPERFVMALGSRTPNKNLALVRDIAPDLALHGIGVVIVGGSNARVFGEDAAAEASSITTLGRVSDDDIAFLMARARACLFPSFYEGFGLPPVEAMAHGCPVVASDRSAIPEVLGDAALICDPTDRAAWIDAVLRLDRDPDLRGEMVRRGHARAAGHRWRDSAEALLKLVHATR